MKFATAILLGGLIAGAADIIYAMTHYNLVYGTPPERILQSVAAGLLGGEQARAGGWNTAAIGLAAHMVLALIMALIFNIAAKFVRPLASLWYVTGPLYGIAIMFVMNYLVVPNSAAGGPAQLPEGQFLYGAIFAHTILVGLPIAWFANRVTASEAHA
jgi:uncharacterized membrane protein YagU involved in acid resistance